nr:hypothetical protein BCU10_03550 [Vibrio splendidus]PMK58101.1 hypothetical protein BCT96_17345 [Vibrio splendidus]
MFNKQSPEYLQNGEYNIHGITFSTLWAYKKSRTYMSGTNTPAINTHQSNILTRMGYPSIITVPDIGGFDQVKAFPVQSIEYFIDHINPSID